MSAQPLFDSAESMALAIDQQIADLLHGDPSYPSGHFLAPPETAVLRAIRYRRGAGNPIGIRELVSRLKITEREIKQIVRTLRVDFRLSIGSSKSATNGGYFLIVSIADQEIAARSPLDQIRAEVEVLKLLTSAERTRELLGQISLEVQ